MEQHQNLSGIINRQKNIVVFVKSENNFKTDNQINTILKDKFNLNEC